MDYIPTSEAELRDWAVQVLANLPQIAQDLNLDAQEVQFASRNLNDLINSYDDCQAKQTAWLASVAHKAEVKEVAIQELRLFLKNIKTRRGYSNRTGRALNIFIPKAAEVDLDALKPEPKITKIADGVKISYKKGIATGVKIYCRRGNETEFSFLTMHDVSFYVDNRVNLHNLAAEKREYYFIYFRKGQNIGQQSDIASITV